MHVMHIKKLKKRDKIVNNLSAEERKSFMEMLQREELGWSKDNQHEVFLSFFIKNEFTFFLQEWVGFILKYRHNP